MPGLRLASASGSPSATWPAARGRCATAASPDWHCPSSVGRVRATCSTTAGRFRISTTRPSPRIEAPETRSVGNVWSSKALITNSSSPSSASTINPYFLSPTVMTSTKSLALRSPVSHRSAQPQQRQHLVAQLQTLRSCRPDALRFRRCAQFRPPRSAEWHTAAAPPRTAAP